MSVLVGVCLLSPGYGQAGFLDKALDFGKDLLGKAALNYSNKYEKKLNQVVRKDLLRMCSRRQGRLSHTGRSGHTGCPV